MTIEKLFETPLPLECTVRHWIQLKSFRFWSLSLLSHSNNLKLLPHLILHKGSSWPFSIPISCTTLREDVGKEKWEKWKSGWEWMRMEIERDGFETGALCGLHYILCILRQFPLMTLFEVIIKKCAWTKLEHQRNP